jgi:hypothetical protein
VAAFRFRVIGVDRHEAARLGEPLQAIWSAREVAVIGADTAQDVHPSGYPDLRSPLHLVGIVALGLWLIDNCDLEALAAACQRRGRWAFHLAVAPLRLVGVTGSPVNPLATF